MKTWCRTAIAPVASVASLSPKIAALYFSQAERRNAAFRAFPAEALAARLAAKSALKYLLFALGWEWPLPLARLEILSLESGLPVVRISDPHLRRFFRMNVASVSVSLSHTHALGAAAVLLKRKSA